MDNLTYMHLGINNARHEGLNRRVRLIINRARAEAAEQRRDIARAEVSGEDRAQCLL